MNTEWNPTYEPWRHGGYYVTNVHYPSGAVGCVSNNFTDKRWRIVCGQIEVNTSFPTRDTAARAEYALTLALTQEQEVTA